jgi:hypothetical protein
MAVLDNRCHIKIANTSLLSNSQFANRESRIYYYICKNHSNEKS